MAQGDFILTLTGIRGESNDKDFPEAVEVGGWSFSGASTWDPTTGQTQGRVRLGEIVVTKRIDISTPILIKFMCENRTIEDAVLINRKAGGNRQEGFFKITMKNARVRSVSHKANSVGGTVLEETVGLAWNTIIWSHNEQGNYGSLAGGPSEYTYDWATNLSR
ncbi:MAG: type VI secretion system tube protein Hcp [Micropepsaceae bacterium]